MWKDILDLCVIYFSIKAGVKESYLVRNLVNATKNKRTQKESKQQRKTDNKRRFVFPFVLIIDGEKQNLQARYILSCVIADALSDTTL